MGDPLGQVGQQRVGHHGLFQADLGQQAEQVGQQRRPELASQRRVHGGLA
jgi:hypothetical protein